MIVASASGMSLIRSVPGVGRFGERMNGDRPTIYRGVLYNGLNLLMIIVMVKIF